MNTCAVSRLISPSLSHNPNEQFEPHVEGTAAAFLYAWKQGIALAGSTYFGDGTQIGLNKADSRWDLRPNLLLIKNSISVLSVNECAFLAAMVSFYNCDEGNALLKQVGVRGLADLGALDSMRRDVIASLVRHNHSW
jgi:hypothetical protein